MNTTAQQVPEIFLGVLQHFGRAAAIQAHRDAAPSWVLGWNVASVN